MGRKRSTYVQPITFYELRQQLEVIAFQNGATQKIQYIQ
jgi:hypothetical protein